MIVRWYGHSCFYFYSKKGSRILTDPFDESIGYPFPPLTCDICLMSHEHMDHSAAWRVQGEPYLAKRTTDGPCEFEITVPVSGETFLLRGIPSYHDEALGRKRGPNTIFAWEMDQYRVCHLGDLGHMLSPDAVKDIGKVDLLCLPVGDGEQVLNAKEAALVVDALSPSMIFPMHYKTSRVDMGLDGLKPFLKLMTQIERTPRSQIEISGLPGKPTVVVFEA